MKAVVAAFNQEKALVGAFSVITNPRMDLFEALVTMSRSCPRQIRRLLEFVMLVKASLCFLLLVYIHVVYTRHPVQVRPEQTSVSCK